jgi:Swt1-like HEPN
MSEENVMSWILAANGARPSAAIVETQGFREVVRVCEEQSRAVAEMAKSVGMFDRQVAFATEFERIRDLIELPHAKFLNLANEVRLGPVSQALAAFEKAMPNYQGFIGTMSAISAAEKMLLKDIDLGAKSLKLQNIMAAPGLAEMAKTADMGLEGLMPDGVARFLSGTSGLQEAMESMQAQWRDIEKSASSFASFVELQSIGLGLENIPAFDDSLAAALRIDLGDWRDSILWKPEVFADEAARSSLYESLGFNRSLTAFTVPVFERSLDIAGLRRTRPTLVTLYGEPIPAIDDDAKEGLVRTNTAHEWLLRLETQLRAFIDKEMTKAFGTDWPNHRLPNGLYNDWQEKKKKAVEAGGSEMPLIAYADFTDYERVICKGDNWRVVFTRFFGKPESVRESLQRLCPIRICTMHARPITKEDELLLFVEAKRLGKAFIR